MLNERIKFLLSFLVTGAIMRILTIFFMLIGMFQNIVYAELTLLKKDIITDSEEPVKRRTYSYDFDVTKQGIIHAIYSKPVANKNRSQIIYMTKPVGGNWPEIKNRTVLEEFGNVETISTWLMLDSNDIAHISYIVNRDFVDKNGTTHTHGLVYQKIENGKVSKKTNVSPGGFHSRMQLNNKNQAIFAREYEAFMNKDGTFRKSPFPKALQLLIPSATIENTWHFSQLDLPNAVDYRLGNFIYEAQRNRFHIIFGDQDAVFLRNTYPSTNPPVTPNDTPVPFPSGTGHKLWYAFSDNIINDLGNLNDNPTWKTSLIDNSGDISENEFWTDLVLDKTGTPFAANYRYATDEQGVQQGSSNIIGRFNGQSWVMQTVAGKTTGASQHRAGMGPKLLIDEDGGFHGIWDNSPDKPIDGVNKPIPGTTPGGAIMYRYSPDGKLWQTAKQILLPFSAEGTSRAKLFNGKLLHMVLGDARDTKVFFAEYNLPTPDKNLFEISSDKMFYGDGEIIRMHARIQGNTIGDLYAVVAGPYNVDSDGNLFPVTGTFKFSYLAPNFTWQPYTDLTAIKPVIRNFSLGKYNVDFLFPIAKNTPPFANPARYVVYSAVNAPGLAIGNFLTPLYSYNIHICAQIGCSEL